jgi:hypothetical protein
VDMHCPLQLWYEFSPQVELTLNMLCFSRRNSNKSANQEVYGNFDFNKTPLAPLGTKALIYNDPVSRLAGNVVFSDVVRSWFWRHGVVSSQHVGPTRPTCRRHHVMSGSFFLCRMSCRYLIADMSW